MPTRREMEMRQGAYIAEMNAKREFISRHGCLPEVFERRKMLVRWREGNKVSFGSEYGAEGTEIEITLRNDRSVRWSERYGPDWPSEALVANIGLAIGALDDFAGVPAQTPEETAYSEQRKRRDEYRKTLTPPEFWDK